MYGLSVKNVYASVLKGRGTLEKDSPIGKRRDVSVGCLVTCAGIVRVLIQMGIQGLA